ncbi:hypothetical protein ABBQ38_007007 [Trebouxia sp. C0009 RCD-2024]
MNYREEMTSKGASGMSPVPNTHGNKGAKCSMAEGHLTQGIGSETVHRDSSRHARPPHRSGGGLKLALKLQLYLNLGMSASELPDACLPRGSSLMRVYSSLLMMLMHGLLVRVGSGGNSSSAPLPAPLPVDPDLQQALAALQMEEDLRRAMQASLEDQKQPVPTPLTTHTAKGQGRADRSCCPDCSQYVWIREHPFCIIRNVTCITPTKTPHLNQSCTQPRSHICQGGNSAASMCGALCLQALRCHTVASAAASRTLIEEVQHWGLLAVIAAAGSALPFCSSSAIVLVIPPACLPAAYSPSGSAAVAQQAARSQAEMLAEVAAESGPGQSPLVKQNQLVRTRAADHTAASQDDVDQASKLLEAARQRAAAKAADAAVQPVASKAAKDKAQV